MNPARAVARAIIAQTVGIPLAAPERSCRLAAAVFRRLPLHLEPAAGDQTADRGINHDLVEVKRGAIVTRCSTNPNGLSECLHPNHETDTCRCLAPGAPERFPPDRGARSLTGDPGEENSEG